MGKVKSLVTTMVTAALVVSLTSCSNDGADPEAAAGEFASALSQLNVSSVPFTGVTGKDADKMLQQTTQGLDPLKPDVTVANVQTGDDGSATVKLKYTWDIEGSKNWTYTTSTDMTLAEDQQQWRFSWAPSVVAPMLDAGERLTMQPVAAERAEIWGAGNEVLVTDRPVIRVGIDKTRIKTSGLEESAAALAELMELDADEYTSRVKSAGSKAFVEAITIRDDADRKTSDKEINAIEGARGIPDEMSLAPTRDFARPIVGTVGSVTAQMVEKSDGELQPGDTAGLTGLQRYHNEHLSGTDGRSIVVQPKPVEDGGSAAAEPQVVFEVKPEPGKPLKTTLDKELQLLAEDVLKAEESASAIVAMQPSTGHILAAANGPGSDGYATGMVGRYPPGSTFKIATSLGLIRQGMTPSSTVSCTDTVTVNGRTYKNAPTYPDSALGKIPLKQAVAHSCNTAFISESGNLPQSKLASAAEALGIGVETDLGYPAFFGSVPTEADGTAHAASMIGQGQVLVSTLSLATMGASVGEGDRVTPQLLRNAGNDGGGNGSNGSDGSDGSDGDDGGSTEPSAGSVAKPVTGKEAGMLRDMMRAVVTEGGAYMLQDIPGPPVIAKTGTAEYGTENPPRTHAWMVAVQGDLAVAVFVEEGEYGSTSGGPLMQEFLAGAAKIRNSAS
ncbi:penicillin-binding transpeptidase domain-containing protein [Arthrobacter castelli]|uniref:penicillin-binding transpeptidase domain-containing protein n=1 Tax=Arthrobacter castelli TaxID=271431 RepID=UPI000415A221|nr:penicillin-binding transpeptidase domain-containing protein [Arthrobacter castelli]